MDVKGLDNELLNLLSSRDFSVNARFTYANFTLAPEDPRSADVTVVDGSHMTEVFIVIKTVVDGKPALVHAAFGVDPFSRSPHKLQPYNKVHLKVTDLESDTSIFDVMLGIEDEAAIVGDVTVGMTDTRGTAVVANANWRCTITPGIYRTSVGRRHRRLDVDIAALTDALDDQVAPHGLIGQGFDGQKIDGRVDDYVSSVEDGKFTTSAQGEGAIEGTVHDYVVDAPFSTTFKFGRFGATTAPPRDVSKLNRAA